MHELTHTLAGLGAGRGRGGRPRAPFWASVSEAGGQAYSPEHFDASVWATIEALPHPSDGQPRFRQGAAVPRAPRPCPLGIGTRGGKSRGTGSGSRMRLCVCGCPEGTPGRKVRTACDTWDASCNRCATIYRRA